MFTAFDRDMKGLTLVELMVAVAILSLVSIAVSSLYLNSQKSYYYLQGSAQNMQEARYAIDVLSRDLRTAVSISVAGEDNVTFVGDYDGNGTTETISYSRSGVNISRTIGAQAAKTIASGIVNSVSLNSEQIFKYYNQSGSITADLAQVKLIEVEVMIDKDTGSVPSRSTQVTSRIQLRNLHERR